MWFRWIRACLHRTCRCHFTESFVMRLKLPLGYYPPWLNYSKTHCKKLIFPSYSFTSFIIWNFFILSCCIPQNAHFLSTKVTYSVHTYSFLYLIIPLLSIHRTISIYSDLKYFTLKIHKRKIKYYILFANILQYHTRIGYKHLNRY